MPALMTRAAVLLVGSATAAMPLLGPRRQAEAFDHVHLSVPEPAAATEWYLEHIGGRRVDQPDRLAFGPVLIIFLRRAADAAGSAGSGVDHIAFAVRDAGASMNRIREAGVTITADTREEPGLFRHGFIEDPWGTRIEIIEAPEPTAFHHVHLRSPDPARTLRWYGDNFGGESTRYGSLNALRFGDVWIFVDDSEGAEVPPTAGRALDHIGWSFADLDATAAQLKARGIRFIQEPMPFRDPKVAIKIGFIEGPDGVKIEIVQRPRPWPPWDVRNPE